MSNEKRGARFIPSSEPQRSECLRTHHQPHALSAPSAPWRWRKQTPRPCAGIVCAWLLCPFSACFNPDACETPASGFGSSYLRTLVRNHALVSQDVVILHQNDMSHPFSTQIAGPCLLRASDVSTSCEHESSRVITRKQPAPAADCARPSALGMSPTMGRLHRQFMNAMRLL